VLCFHSSDDVILSPFLLYAYVVLSITQKLYCLRQCSHILLIDLLENVIISQHNIAYLLCDQAFREYYPSIYDDGTILECVWSEYYPSIHDDGTIQNQKSCGPETAILYETLGLVNEG
jgi:hypothetical protein